MTNKYKDSNKIKNNVKINEKDIFYTAVFILIGILTRTTFHIGANIEFVTGLSISAGFFFKNKRISFLVPFLIMFFSDLIIGNTNIFWFTWSGFLAGPVIGIMIDRYIAKKDRTRLSRTVTLSTAGGVISTLIFYIWTNLGVVLLTNMYSKDVEGLIQSYINALPFLRNQFLGNLFIVPLTLVSIIVFNRLSSSSSLFGNKLTIYKNSFLPESKTRRAS
ncbi:hypothetical protein GF362_06670 [Candidatus Dojkabacteria bacterium]|nr:hypothetical protein [Candidatus Dojkabacteria bacterium]